MMVLRFVFDKLDTYREMEKGNRVVEAIEVFGVSCLLVGHDATLALPNGLEIRSLDLVIVVEERLPVQWSEAALARP